MEITIPVFYQSANMWRRRCGGWGRGEISDLGREREEGAEASCEGDRLGDLVPDAICGAAAPALPVDAVSMATGGGRAGPEPRSRGAASPAPAPNPRPGSPACDAGLAPFGVTASSFPSLWSPNHWDPGPARGSSSSWGSGGAAMAGGPPGAATAAWLGRGAVAGRAGGRSLLLPPPGLGTWGGCGVSTAAAAAATPAELLPLSSRQLLLLPLLFLWAPPPALLLPLQAPPRRLPRYSQACYYAGENGLLRPSPPQHTSASGLLMADPAEGMCQIHLNLPLIWGGIKAQDAQVEAAPSWSVND